MGRTALTQLVCALAIATGLFCLPQLAVAQDAISAPAQKAIGGIKKTEMVPSLIVMNAQGATLEGEKLTLNGVASNSIVFADRPVRAAGHALTTHLLEEWTPSPNEGDSFAKDPPNATVSVFSKDGAKVRDAVVVLKSPKLEGDRLTFDVTVLEGDLAGADGPASVFIDIIGRPLTPLSFAGVARRTARRGAWYGAGAAVAAGAAVGAAAAAAPYYSTYPPACGYYPYPPCYPY
jgi:hypothetical protein